MGDYGVKILIFLLLVNLAVAVFVFVYYIVKKEWKKGAIEAFFFLMVPVAGAGLFGAAKAVNKVISLFHRGEHEINERELSFSKERQKEWLNPDIQKGINQVPVEEALLMSDRMNKRQVFIDLLKTDDFDNSMRLIKDAVENDDMEIAHFAAAFVTDAQARYKEKEQELYKDCSMGGSMYWMEYSRYVLGMLQYDIFSIPEKKVYLSHLDEVMKKLREEGKDSIPGEMAARMAEQCWSVQDERTKEWIQITMEYSMENLDAFKACLKYYYECQKKEEFFDLLQSVKNSSLALDNEALEWIRFFSEPGNDKE